MQDYRKLLLDGLGESRRARSPAESEQARDIAKALWRGRSRQNQEYSTYEKAGYPGQ